MEEDSDDSAWDSGREEDPLSRGTDATMPNYCHSFPELFYQSICM